MRTGWAWKDLKDTNLPWKGEENQTLNVLNFPARQVIEINVRNMNRAALAFMLFMSDLWRGNWGHVSDNRKLRSQPSAGKQAPLITQTGHHGQTRGRAHTDWPWLMSYGSIFTNITHIAVAVWQCLCVRFCPCVFFSGSWVIKKQLV